MRARTGKRIRRLGPEVSSFDWSPDGRHIVYEPGRDQSGLFVLRADGKGLPRLLTRATGWDVSEPVWSPDGRRVAYVGRRYPVEATDYAVWTIGVAGRHKKRILQDREVEDVPSEMVLSWQPRPR